MYIWWERKSLNHIDIYLHLDIICFQIYKHIRRTSGNPFKHLRQQSSWVTPTNIQGQKWWTAVFRALSRWGQGGACVTRPRREVGSFGMGEVVVLAASQKSDGELFCGFIGGNWRGLDGIHENGGYRVLMWPQECGESRCEGWTFKLLVYSLDVREIL